MTMICIGSAADNTFRHLLVALGARHVAYDVIDYACLTLAGTMHAPLDDLRAATLSLHGRVYELGAYRGAWVRLADIAQAAPSESLRLRSRSVYRWLSRVFSYVPLRVINPPLRDYSNFSKFYHAVALARVGGWRIPRSCLTNDPERARDFIAACPGEVIFKGASAHKTWASTYRPDDAHRLPLLRTSPVLFQERIVGPDVRVHVVGERVFAEMIESTGVDYRIGRGNTYRQVQLPADVAIGCVTLSRDCDTPFLGIDFKLDDATGDWVFLEANSLPCYEGYDRRAGGAISLALVDFLAEPCSIASPLVPLVESDLMVSDGDTRGTGAAAMRNVLTHGG